MTEQVQPRFYVRRVGKGHTIYHKTKMFEHHTEKSAWLEADRLAREHPGVKFVVLKDIGFVRAEPLVITTPDLIQVAA